MRPSETTPSLWKLNPAVRIAPFDGSGSARWLVELDDAEGGTQRMLVSGSLAEALKRFAQPQSLKALTRQFHDEGWSGPGLSQLATAISDVAIPKSLIIPAHAEAAPAPRQQRKPAYMTAMVQLLPPRVVNPLARMLAPLFGRRSLVLGVGVAILGQVLMIQALRTPRSFSTPTSADILILLGLGAAVVLLHELGHAAAAWRGGARRVAVGAGWYVLFPVAYADLSETWRFGRRQRALIDVAGVYTQSLATCALMLLYALSANGLFLLAAVAASLSILWNLNPLLRMDGYWLLSDLLGASNLRAEALASLKHAWNRFVSGRWRVDAPPITLPARTSTGLAVYAAVCLAFFAYVVVLALTRFSSSVIELLAQPSLGLAALVWSETTWTDRVVLVGAAAWKLVIVYFLGRFLLKLVRYLVSSLNKLRLA